MLINSVSRMRRWKRTTGKLSKQVAKLVKNKKSTQNMEEKKHKREYISILSLYEIVQ